MTTEELDALVAIAKGAHACGDAAADLLDRIIGDAITEPAGPLTSRKLADIVAKVECPTVDVETRSLAEGGHLVRVCAWRDDHEGKVERQAGRWFYVSSHATDSEVVQTVWLAWQVFEQHELREAFLFDGVAVFHPHQRIERLAEFVANDERDVRSTPTHDQPAQAWG